MIKKGEWVRIHRVVLTPDERSPNLPDATKAVPLVMWTKGRLKHNSEIGDWVQVETRTQRIEEGYLVEVHPAFHYDYGDFVDEIHTIDAMVLHELQGDHHEK